MLPSKLQSIEYAPSNVDSVREVGMVIFLDKSYGDLANVKWQSNCSIGNRGD